MSEEPEESKCNDCDYVGPMDEVDNPEYLWGVVGCTTTICPECGASQDDLFA